MTLEQERGFPSSQLDQGHRYPSEDSLGVRGRGEPPWATPRVWVLEPEEPRVALRARTRRDVVGVRQ